VTGPALAAYATDPGDLILAATALALAHGHTAVTIEAETHGRHDLPGDLDPSRTVGWFTSTHPVVVATTDPAAAVISAKEGRRRPPGGPLAYGLAARDPESGVPLVTPSVAVNYLGVLDTIAAETGFHPSARPTGPAVSPANRLPQAIVINASVARGELHLDVQTDPTINVTTLIAQIEDALAQVAAHCLAQTAPTPTASDYQSPTLAQSELSDIAALLDL
jgi:non-ribosomal peptide synthase protein (TIGR01720 family)